MMRRGPRCWGDLRRGGLDALWPRRPAGDGRGTTRRVERIIVVTEGRRAGSGVAGVGSITGPGEVREPAAVSTRWPTPYCEEQLAVTW